MEKVLMCAGVTLSQQLLPQLDLLQEELLNRFSVLQVWKLQHKKHSASRKQIDRSSLSDLTGSHNATNRNML